MAGFEKKSKVQEGRAGAAELEPLAESGRDSARSSEIQVVEIGTMQVADDLVFHKICKMLEQFNSRNVTLTTDTDITGDLQIDSVAVLDLIMEVEDEYEISFPMNLLSEIRTVGDLVQAIHNQAGEQD